MQLEKRYHRKLGDVSMWLTVCVLTVALAIGFAAAAFTLEN
jgi:hypothetical protein